jgi:hypothetical protein
VAFTSLQRKIGMNSNECMHVQGVRVQGFFGVLGGGRMKQSVAGPKPLKLWEAETEKQKRKRMDLTFHHVHQHDLD